ncbi:hypothetical protein G4Y73_05615 [Wenzhouxiangella sp. XN201]|uniref:hypothetical protein n=1 Tax=Wenzhouxiangella sp. XN201 TaxID=2710755 RepID=UPI0013C7C302|nr:hypothetical protein [Wenzhouxiangella sp. XN201]NEZ03630.1 hypothetical protein [Wenzhouxiangella sp. XN201]
MKAGFTYATMLTALVLLPLRVVATDACVLDTAEDTVTLPDGVLLAYRAPETARVPGAIDIECRGQQVERISVVLPAGSGRELVLLVGSLSGVEIKPGLDESEDWANVVVEASRDGTAGRVLISFRAPGDAEEGTVLAGDLQLYVPATREDRGPTSIPLQLTVRGEAPLFRDQFDVDPVIGQFSQVM